MTIIRRILKHLIILWIFVTILLSITATTTPVHASSAVMAVNPPTIIGKTLTLGSTFSIIVTLADVQQLWTYAIMLRYNASVINATNVDTLDPRFTIGVSEIGGNWTAVAQGTYMGDPEGITSTTPIPVSRVDFNVTGYGATTLHLDPDICGLEDVDGNEITPLLLIEGWFSNTVSYDELLSTYLALNSTYYQLLAEHNELSTDYTTLQSSHNQLLANYDELSTNYIALQSSYNDLASQHNSLNSEYDELQNSYQSLQANHTDLKEQYDFLQGESSVFRNLTYVLAVIAIASVGATIYIAVRKRHVTP